MRKQLVVLFFLPFLVAADDAGPETLAPEIEAELLLGPFEGHGLLPPKNPKKALRARVIAQRLAQPCRKVSENRSGGTTLGPSACKTETITSAELPAILDQLNDATIPVWTESDHWMTSKTYSSMLDVVGSVGKETAVKPLITALHRYALRETYADYFAVELEAHARFAAVESALRKITFHRVERDGDLRYYPKTEKPPVLTLTDVVARWRKWREAHGDDSRASWRLAALTAARARLAQSDPKARLLGLADLRALPNTKAELKKEAERLAKDEPDLAREAKHLAR